MLPKFKKLSLEKQLFLSFFSVSACLLVLSLGISLFYNVNRRKAEIDSLISGVAAYAASMDQVIHMLDSGYPDRETAAALDGLHENFPDLNVIAIYDRNLLRFYHTTRRESGESLINGEEQAVLISPLGSVPTEPSAGPFTRSWATTVPYPALSWPQRFPPISPSSPGRSFPFTRLCWSSCW